MWNRLSRAVRSFIGFFISVAENPELILEQNIRDMNDQVPRMNESIAMVKANQTLLEKEEAKYKNDVADLTSKVKAAIQAGRDDIAGSYAMQLEQMRGARPALPMGPAGVHIAPGMPGQPQPGESPSTGQYL